MSNRLQWVDNKEIYLGRLREGGQLYLINWHASTIAARLSPESLILTDLSGPATSPFGADPSRESSAFFSFPEGYTASDLAWIGTKDGVHLALTLHYTGGRLVIAYLVIPRLPSAFGPTVLSFDHLRRRSQLFFTEVKSVPHVHCLAILPFAGAVAMGTLEGKLTVASLNRSTTSSVVVSALETTLTPGEGPKGLFDKLLLRAPTVGEKVSPILGTAGLLGPDSGITLLTIHEDGAVRITATPRAGGSASTLSSLHLPITSSIVSSKLVWAISEDTKTLAVSVEDRIIVITVTYTPQPVLGIIRTMVVPFAAGQADGLSITNSGWLWVAGRLPDGSREVFAVAADPDTECLVTASRAHPLLGTTQGTGSLQVYSMGALRAKLAVEESGMTVEILEDVYNAAVSRNRSGTDTEYQFRATLLVTTRAGMFKSFKDYVVAFWIERLTWPGRFPSAVIQSAIGGIALPTYFEKCTSPAAVHELAIETIDKCATLLSEVAMCAVVGRDADTAEGHAAVLVDSLGEVSAVTPMANVSEIWEATFLSLPSLRASHGPLNSSLIRSLSPSSEWSLALAASCFGQAIRSGRLVVSEPLLVHSSQGSCADTIADLLKDDNLACIDSGQWSTAERALAAVPDLPRAIEGLQKLIEEELGITDSIELVMVDDPSEVEAAIVKVEHAVKRGKASSEFSAVTNLCRDTLLLCVAIREGHFKSTRVTPAAVCQFQSLEHLLVKRFPQLLSLSAGLRFSDDHILSVFTVEPCIAPAMVGQESVLMKRLLTQYPLAELATAYKPSSGVAAFARAKAELYSERVSLASLMFLRAADECAPLLAGKSNQRGLAAAARDAIAAFPSDRFMLSKASYYLHVAGLFNAQAKFREEINFLKEAIKTAKSSGHASSLAWFISQINVAVFERALSLESWDDALSMLNDLSVDQCRRCCSVLCAEAKTRGKVMELVERWAHTPEGKAANLLGVLIEDTRGFLAVSEDDTDCRKLLWSLLLYNSNAVDAAVLAYEGFLRLLCPVSSCGGVALDSEADQADLLDSLEDRLSTQQEFLTLSRAALAAVPIGLARLVHSEGVKQELTMKLVDRDLARLEGVHALISYPDLLGIHSEAALAKILSSLGLVIIGSKVAVSFGHDKWKCVVLPYLELLLRIERGDAQLPPFKAGDRSSYTTALCKADSISPLGCGSDGLRAMWHTLEALMASFKFGDGSIILRLIDRLMCVGRPTVPYMFISLLEKSGNWPELVRLYMSHEKWSDAVRVVEAQLKLWRPEPIGPVKIQRLAIPLLLQLEECIAHFCAEDGLKERLDATLTSLKQTLHELDERYVR